MFDFIFFLRIQSLQNKIQFSAGKEPFDYISVTPPYMEVDYAVLMDQISNSALVGEDTFIVSCFFYKHSAMCLCFC